MCVCTNCKQENYIKLYSSQFCILKPSSYKFSHNHNGDFNITSHQSLHCFTFTSNASFISTHRLHGSTIAYVYRSQLLYWLPVLAAAVDHQDAYAGLAGASTCN